ncbi:3-epi-6-deoxocathasterone 23-monooxygenase CYP90D1-like [Camellia sinensis]|uniref:3-epi-6-deoxocathasterone 23-monooxygenase CYP90D1-like n=1 Tax=Camellia sinensis TaxID=4442 RepID=UPI001036CBA8|nr:3-epi-6-deoxocathasterone 23-monooxygenase CYP90D1-like [Camellia sinensis]
MDNTYLIVAVLVTSIFLLSSSTIFLYRKRRSCRRSPVPLPLGTLGWPFLGETISFVSCAYSDHPETFMDQRRHMYGKVFKSHLFGSPTIVSTDAEVSRFVLQSDSKAFVPSYPKSLTELMGKSSILLITGSLQRRIHGLIGSFFKSSHLKAQITQDMHKYLQQSMENWRDDHPIYIQDEAKNIAFQVLVKALVSMDSGDDTEFLKKQFQEFMAGLMSLPINIPGSRLHRSLQAKKKMVELVHKIIEAKRKNRGRSEVAKGKSAGEDGDEATTIAGDGNGDGDGDGDGGRGGEGENIGGDGPPETTINGVAALLTAAGDGSWGLLEGVLEMFFTFPAPFVTSKKKRRKDELREPLCWTDYLSLPFTQTVITETLRMGNVIVGVMRKAMKDVEIKGYLIPKGWCVFTYFRSIHLDQNLYDSPYQFNPWRWQNREMMSNYSSIFTPFGGGQRLCPGIDLARLEASIFLHHFVTQFRWVAEADSIVNFPTVRMKKRMPVWVKRRI